ncbi:MAG: PAS domain-containing protein, partial [Halobacteriota archaeon]
SQAGHTLATDEPIIVEDLTTEERFSGPDLLVDHDVKSGISVIIGSRDDPWGVLGTHARDVRTFTEHDVSFVQNVANVLAGVLAIDETIERLREVQERFHLVTNNITEVVWINDTEEGTLVYLSPAFEAIWGRAGEALLEGDETFLQTVHPDDRDRMEDALESLEEGDVPYDETYRIVRPDGEVRWIHDRGVPVRDDEGTPIRYVGVARDVTEVERRSRELERERDRFSALFENLAVPALYSEYVGEHPVIQGVNPAFERVFGYDASDIVGEVIDDVIVPDESREDAEELNRRVHGGDVVDTEVVRQTADGLRTFHLVSAPLGPDEDVRGGFALYTDITERKRRERELERHRDLFDQTQEMASIGAWEYDVRADQGWWTDQVSIIHGLSPAVEPDPELSLEYYHPEDRPQVREAFRQAVEEGKPYDLEVRLIDAEGDERWVRTKGEPRFDGDEVVRVRGTLQDVTTQKRYERELERMRALLTDAERLGEVGAWAIDVDTDELFWSDGARRIHGVSDAIDPTLEEALGYIHPDDRDRIRQLYEACMEQGEPFTTRARLERADGEERWIAIRGEAVEPDRIRGYVQDVTDQVSRNQQLAVLDRVLRHNLRNDMNAILGHAELIEEGKVDDPAGHAAHIRHVADGLLSFSEKERALADLIVEPNGTRQRPLAQLVRPPLDIIREAYPDATITVASLPSVDVTALETLEVAVRELVENAIEHCDRPEPRVTIDTTVEGDIVELRIADNGPGIPAHERDIIESEGETDPLVHGSGMGLWLVKWIVQRSGGRLRFYENEPRGSVVCVRLGRPGAHTTS